LKVLTTPPVLSFVGSSGSGKTTVMEKLIPCLVRRGIKVGTIKHDVHGFEMDRPGKDSWRLKKAGAAVSVVSSPDKIGMVRDVEYDHHPSELADLFHGVNIIVAEGYKRARIQKIEVFRSEIGKEPVCRDDSDLLAIVCDSPLDLDVPRFQADDLEGLARFIIDSLKLLPKVQEGRHEIVQ